MYLPKFKYKKARYTQGREFFIRPSSKPYIGWYFETYKGEYYTGKEPGDNNKLLTPFKPVVENDRYWPGRNPSKRIFTPQVITPTEYDRKQGFFIRYFLQDKRDKRIVEVNKEKYLKFKDTVYIGSALVNWVIKGPAQNVEWLGYHYEGAASKNQKTVEQVEHKLPNIKSVIKSYDEFVE